MEIHRFKTEQEMGAEAAEFASRHLLKVLQEKVEVHIILATGSSQFTVLDTLVQSPIPWEKVNVFHLDEYIGLTETHPASFVNYLNSRFVKKVSKLKKFVKINGMHPVPAEECQRLNKIIKEVDIDLALVGIGENGHLAFNDPPADFETEEPYLVVQLDEACRKQQLGEGWFGSVEDVPKQAISMSIRQIMKSKHIICSVPGERKALAVKNCLQGPISPLNPASILQRHKDCQVFLDDASAGLLR